MQARLSEQRAHHVTTRSRSAALLQGRIFDDRDNRMTLTHATKQGVRYRYYVSSTLMQGQVNVVAAISRVPAAEIETLVLQAVRDRVASDGKADDTVIASHIERVQIRPGAIAVSLRAPEAQETYAVCQRDALSGPDGSAHLLDLMAPDALTIIIPWQKAPLRSRREIMMPEGSSDLRPARAETRDKLIASVATARRWLAEIVAGSVRVEDIAAREGCSLRRVTMMLSLAFLSPALVKAATEHRLPRGIGVSRLFDAPAEWSRQHEMLGLRSS